MVDSRVERERDEGGKKAMEGFRERLNKNDFNRGNNGGRGRKDWDEDGKPINGGGGDRDRDRGWGERDGGKTPRNRVMDTPNSVAGRIKNQSWDSTPSSSRGGGGEGDMLPPRPQSWESTPRSIRGSTGGGGGGRNQGEREWDTPRTSRSIRISDGESPGLIETPFSVVDSKAWEEEQTKLDREWYNTDEAGGGDVDGGAFDGYNDYASPEPLVGTSAAAGGVKKRVTARQAAFNADNEAWEDNRLALSGVTGQRRKLDFDALDDGEESRVHLLVHDLKPPFLDGRLSFTRQLDPVNPIKDPTSDLAVFAKKGSGLVAEIRARKEREKVGPFLTTFLRAIVDSSLVVALSGRSQSCRSGRNHSRKFNWS